MTATGEGPGSQTADGCSVELYRLIPYRGELEAVHELFQSGASILELGSGTGRMTRRLLDFGCRVTAVDNSQEMLAEVPQQANRIVSDIESLELGSTFDIILLASVLINHPDVETRQAFVATARRHARARSHFLVQSHDPDWLRNVQIGPLGVSDGIGLGVEALARDRNLVHMTLRYEATGRAWRQSFSTVVLERQEIERLLADGGFVSFD